LQGLNCWGDITGDGTVDILTAPFSDSLSEIRVFEHFTKLIDDFFAFPTGFVGGAFVG